MLLIGAGGPFRLAARINSTNREENYSVLNTTGRNDDHHKA
jgi:hypothetical protein